ncbi:MAG TPA: hypothetical protein VGL71_03290, partial [Urbifossiella sp.]
MRTLIDPASMAILLLVWPLLLNILTILKTKSKLFFYSISALSTLCMALAAYWYGPVQEPIRISKWVVFSLDAPAWIFVVLIYTCWCITLIYSLGYISAHISSKAETFHRFMNATLSLSIGAGMSDNFFTLLFFYTSSVPTIIPLLLLRSGEPSFRATRFYVHSTLWPVLLIAFPAIACNFPL